MPYKISGTKSETARVIVLKESDWSIESNTVISGSGAYEIDGLEVGDKLVFGRNEDGWIEGYGGVSGEEYSAGGDRGIFGGGAASTNVIEYITISTTGDATNFGDLTLGRSDLAATSNGVTGRGVFGGGWTAAIANVIDYITILTPDNATDFGDLISGVLYYISATSNGTNDRGVFGGGSDGSSTDHISYITISSNSNSIDFGNLTQARHGLAACSNDTNNRGIFGGGVQTGVAYLDVIDYITITSTGNATDFGDLTSIAGSLAACSNGTNDRGIFAGGYRDPVANTIEHITISTTGNAINFGDLTSAKSALAACSNGTNDRGVFGGGSGTDMDYITITSLGDAQDFGDLTLSRYGLAATSNA